MTGGAVAPAIGCGFLLLTVIKVVSKLSVFADYWHAKSIVIAASEPQSLVICGLVEYHYLMRLRIKPAMTRFVSLPCGGILFSLDRHL